MSRPPKRIRWAIVGLGAQAERIARAIQGSPHACLQAVASHQRAHARQFAKNFSAAAGVFTSLDELLRQTPVEALAITSPNDQHAAQCLTALRAHKHVLCEKPLALYTRDARAIAAAVKKSKTIFGVGFQLRFHPVFLAARKIISSGQLGDIRLLEMHWSIGVAGEKKFSPLPVYRRWRESYQKAGGGAIMSRGVHLLDLFSFLTSRRIQAIAALYDAGSQQPVEQLISIVARSHATLCTITTGRQIPYAMNGITLYGSQGRLILSEPFSVNGTGEVRLQSAHQELHKKFTKPVSLYQREIDDFTAAIIEKKKWLGADIHDGVEAVALVTALMAAARHGYDV